MNFPKDLKEKVAEIVKSVTGLPIKMVFHEAEKRIELYSMFYVFKTSSKMSPRTAELELRKHLRNFEIAKEAVKAIFYTQYGHKNYKKLFTREKRNSFYKYYIDNVLKNKGQSRIEVIMTIKFRMKKILEDMIVMMDKLSDCKEGENLVAIIDKKTGKPTLISIENISAQENFNEESFLSKKLGKEILDKKTHFITYINDESQVIEMYNQE